jgi:hypothetical protein
MADHSFTITLSNNKTEKEGIEYLRSRETGYFFVDKHARKIILELLGQPLTFFRSFDMIHIPRFRGTVVTQPTLKTHLDEIILIELKTTKKRLPNFPKGFFFGATANEFLFAEALKEKFQFCFICLHPDTPNHILLSLSDVRALTRTSRVQHQINF